MVKFPAWLVVSCLVAILGFPTVAQAQSGGEGVDFRRSAVGLYFGYDFEVEDPLAGVDMRFSYNVAPQFAVSLNPALTYYFMSDRRVFGVTIESRLVQFDVNALGHLIIDGPIEPYVGLGLAINHARMHAEGWGGEATETETNLGLNLLAGLEVNIDGPLVPFAQLRVTFLEQEELDHANFLAVMAGLSYEF
jgi:opacity protein-like surface antigen